MDLVLKGQDGTELQFRVVDIKDDHIVIDGNHPLAG